MDRAGGEAMELVIIGLLLLGLGLRALGVRGMRERDR